MRFSFHFVLFREEIQHFFPDMIRDPIRMLRASVCIKFSLCKFFVQKLSLPNGMSIILNIIDQQGWQWKLSKSLNVATDRPIHHQKLSYFRIFMNCIENSRTSLGVTKHGKVSLVVQSLKDFLEHLQRESLDSLFTSFGFAIPWTIYGNKVKLFNIGDSNKILMQEVSILIRWILGPRAVNDKNKRLSRHSCSNGVDVPKRRRYDPRCDLL